MVGEITQIPPMYSAIKVKGERLYKAARRGETVERKERRCVIHSFEVTRDDGDDARNVKFRVDCSKGTYVRTPRATSVNDWDRSRILPRCAGRASASTTCATRGPLTHCSRRAGRSWRRF